MSCLYLIWGSGGLLVSAGPPDSVGGGWGMSRGRADMGRDAEKETGLWVRGKRWDRWGRRWGKRGRR